jgi:hypothetical protein
MYCYSYPTNFLALQIVSQTLCEVVGLKMAKYLNDEGFIYLIQSFLNPNPVDPLSKLFMEPSTYVSKIERSLTTILDIFIVVLRGSRTISNGSNFLILY